MLPRTLKYAPEGIFGATFYEHGEWRNLVIKTAVTGTLRNIPYENRVYAELQQLKGRNTGCVFMYPSHDPESLIVEDFGTDIRQYLTPESNVLKNELVKVISAVDALHSCGYIHGDLKPHNILCRALQGGIFEFKLCDLDSATKMGALFNTSKFTKRWVSPEVFQAWKTGKLLIAVASLDIFNLGVLFAAILHDLRSSEMYLLPADTDEGLIQAFSNQPYLLSLMPCGGRGDYKVWVDKMCRYSLMSNANPASHII